MARSTAGAPIVLPGDRSARRHYVRRIYRDQHGREFFAMADAINNEPVTDFVGINCSPPWIPAQSYARFDGDGGTDFRWDYDALAELWSGLTDQYYADARQYCRDKGLEVPEVGGTVSREVREKFGPPMMSPAIPLAAQAGDAWLLGWPEAEVNVALDQMLKQVRGANAAQTLAGAAQWVAGIVQPRPETHTATVGTSASIPDAPETWPAFFAWHKQYFGGGMTEAAEAWKQNKELLAGVA